jgi:hypothetical protein
MFNNVHRFPTGIPKEKSWTFWRSARHVRTGTSLIAACGFCCDKAPCPPFASKRCLWCKRWDVRFSRGNPNAIKCHKQLLGMVYTTHLWWFFGDGSSWVYHISCFTGSDSGSVESFLVWRLLLYVPCVQTVGALSNRDVVYYGLLDDEVESIEVISL